MNKTILTDAIGYVEEEYLNTYITAKWQALCQKKQAAPKRRAALAACAAVVIGATVFALHSLIVPPVVTPGEFQLPVEAQSIVWAKDTTSSLSDQAALTYKKWNNLVVHEDVADMLNTSASDTYIALKILFAEDRYNRISDFVYNGTTYAQYKQEEDEISTAKRKLESLYSYSLRITVEEIYEQYLDEFGQEFLDRYILNGKLLEAVLRADYDTLVSKQRALVKTIDAAHAAFYRSLYQEIFPVFEATGLSVVYKDWGVFLFATPAQLAEITIEAPENYRIFHASESGYHSPVRIPDPSLPPLTEQQVTGFALHKLSLSYDFRSGIEATTDEALVQNLYTMMEDYQHQFDELLILVSTNTTIDSEIWSRMNCRHIESHEYIYNVWLYLPFASLDLEALRDLSQQQGVRSIHITFNDDANLQAQ